jgi:hypothetical protein
LSKIAVVSGWCGKLPKYADLVQQNHQKYCARHGYEYVWFDGKEIVNLMGNSLRTPASVSWLKPYVLSSALSRGFDFVFWTDVDSLFVNQKRGLNDLESYPASFVFTGDAWDLCSAAHLWFRNSNFSYDFLALWLKWQNVKVEMLNTSHQHRDGTLTDQPALNILLHGGPTVGPAEARSTFNSINGFVGNKSRKYRYFRYTHAPITKIGTAQAQKLIHSNFQSHCKVVPQARLNAYPFLLLPAKPANSHSPIVHFPAQHKDKITSFIKS